MSVKVSGLDLSMTATGAAHTVEGAACTHLIKPKSAGDLRLPEIKNRIREHVQGSELILIEGYLNHSHSAGITGMVHGSVRSMLIEEGLKYATLSPSSLKKFATGRGGASKTDMAVAAFKRGGVEFTNDNECDAWWLWVGANDYLGAPVIDLPKAQRQALDSLKMEN
jgi:Holliday junction resolvasome RuvABC endonuclease subunit